MSSREAQRSLFYPALSCWRSTVDCICQLCAKTYWSQKTFISQKADKKENYFFGQPLSQPSKLASWNSLILILSEIISWRNADADRVVLKMSTLLLAGTYSNGQLLWNQEDLPCHDYNTAALLSFMHSTRGTAMMKQLSLHYMYCTSLFY